MEDAGRQRKTQGDRGREKKHMDQLCVGGEGQKWGIYISYRGEFAMSRGVMISRKQTRRFYRDELQDASCKLREKFPRSTTLESVLYYFLIC